MFIYFQISDYYDSSSENDIELRRTPCVFHKTMNPILEMNDRQFKMRFLLPKFVVEKLEQRLCPQLQPRTKRNHALNPIFLILLALRSYATGSFQIILGTYSIWLKERPVVAFTKL